VTVMTEVDPGQANSRVTLVVNPASVKVKVKVKVNVDLYGASS